MERKITLIVFASSLASRDSVFADHSEILKRLEREYDVSYLFPEDLDGSDIDGTAMVFVGSGGVEEMVAERIESLPSYVVLIADGLKNSLAASLEILSWMRLTGRHGRVIHGPTEYIARSVGEYVAVGDCMRNLRGKRVGAVGKPSGWLIASNIDREAVSRKWGIEFCDVSLDEVVEEYSRTTEADVEEATRHLTENALGRREPSEEEIVKAMRLYGAVKTVARRHRLDALTLNCFDLIPTTRTTGCLALALLNEEGIPAGCEGDMQTLLTMMVAHSLTGQPCFMANPSTIISNERHEMVFAHCTIAPQMTDGYVLRNHYESLSGVAVEGRLNQGIVTVVKCGGRQMERLFVSKAQLLECGDNPNMCRTQLHLRLESPLDYFLESSIGNHHVIVRGDWAAPLEAALS